MTDLEKDIKQGFLGLEMSRRTHDATPMRKLTKNGTTRTGVLAPAMWMRAAASRRK